MGSLANWQKMCNGNAQASMFHNLGQAHCAIHLKYIYIYMFKCCQSSPLGFMLSFKPQRLMLSSQNTSWSCLSSPLGFMLSFNPERLMFVKPKHIMVMFIKPIGLHAVFQASKANACQAKTHIMFVKSTKLHDCETSLDVHAIKPNGFIEGCWTCGYCMNMLNIYSNCMLKVFGYSYVCLKCL